MAANKAQGSALFFFLAGLTVACASIAFFSTGLGKLALPLGLVLLAYACWKFFKIKPLEGKISLGSQPAGMKLLGTIVVLAGWAVVLVGINITPSVGGRMTAAIVGIVVSLVGMLFILPAACNKNAIWKG